MKYIATKLGTLALVGVLFLSGCSKGDEGETVNGDLTQPVTLVETTHGETTLGETTDEETTVDPTSGTSPKMDESTAKAMQLEKEINGIKSITLKDLEGNVVDRAFSEEEMKEIETAFNESYIMDTAYIEMITGYSMTIALENGDEVFITSYGDPVFIVATMGEGKTYHLGCETIATILLEGTK